MYEMYEGLPHTPLRFDFQLLTKFAASDSKEDWLQWVFSNDSKLLMSLG